MASPANSPPVPPSSSHYVTQIAQAMWRLRRLTRWEHHLYDDPALTDEERIDKMARVLRHDAALRRHIDRALKALPSTSRGLSKRTRPTPPPPQNAEPGTTRSSVPEVTFLPGRERHFSAG